MITIKNNVIIDCTKNIKEKIKSKAYYSPLKTRALLFANKAPSRNFLSSENIKITHNHRYELIILTKANIIAREFGLFSRHTKPLNFNMDKDRIKIRSLVEPISLKKITARTMYYQSDIESIKKKVKEEII